MPPTFRIRYHTQSVQRGIIKRHVVVQVMRDDSYSVCGVLYLQPDEWAAFIELCQAHHIEVVFDDPSRKAVPANTAAAAL